MKQFIFLCMVVACFLAACNNNKKTVEASSKDTSQIAGSQAKASKVTPEMQNQMAELQKLSPLSNDELKALLPEELMGGKRSGLQAYSASGTGVAEAEYTLNDSTRIHVTISDCGGTGGAGLYNQQYLNRVDYESQTESEYTRTVEFRGTAIESCDNKANKCSLLYFTGKRYLVAMDGKNMHPEGLKQAAMELKI